MTPAQQKALRWIPIALIGALTLHFSITVLYLTPLNPLKSRTMSIVRGYMEPYFSQRWTLFAPDPIQDHRFVLVSCRVRDGAGERETEWLDITTPLLEAKWYHRITPADRLDRAAKAPSLMAFGAPDDVYKELKEHPEEYKDALAEYETAQAAQRKLGMRMFARLASSACDSAFGQGVTSSVHVKYLIRKPPPYSRRAEPDENGEAQIIEFPWMPYERVASL
jgi:hypothetical protein